MTTDKHQQLHVGDVFIKGTTMKSVQVNQIGKAEYSISCIFVENPAAPAANGV